MSWLHNPNFTLRQLQYAVAIADMGGFGTAAEACAVSQPSLSAQVAKLEASLGVQLFERHARKTLVTSAGTELLPVFRRALDASHAIDELTRVLADPYRVTLRIGIIPTVAPYLLPRIVAALTERQRAPRIHWQELQTDVCERALAAGDLDAMLIADPPTLDSTEHQPIGWEPFALVVPQDHPMTGSVVAADLAHEELLLLEQGHCLRDQTVTLCMRPGSKESPYQATSLVTLVQMVAAGLGSSVLPMSAVPLETGRADVRTLNFSSDEIGRTLRLVWRSRSAHRQVLQELTGVMTAALGAALLSQQPG